LTKIIQLKIFEKCIRIKTLYLLLILVTIGILLRLFNLNATGLWMDEIHSAVGTDPDKTLKEVIEYCKTDQPPVFFLMLHGWFKIFPYNDFYGRLLVVLMGSLGIVSMYFLGKEYKNNAVGLMAAFLTSINYMHVDFSRQVRFYPLVFLLSALSYLFYLRVFKKGKKSDFIFYILATSALLNTHYFGLVVFATQFILFVFIILYKKIKDFKFILYSLLSGIIIGLSFVHWLPVVTADLGVSQFHIQPVQWYFPILYYWVYFRDIVTCLVCAYLGFLSIQQIYLQAKKESLSIESIILIGWIAIGFLIPLLYSWIRIPMLEYKYSIIVVPSLLVIIASGFDVLKNEKISGLFVVVLFLSFMINSLFIKSIYFKKPFEEWKEVTQEILKTDNAHQNVFAEYAWYYRYYFKIMRLHDQPYEPVYADFTGILNSSRTIWVIKQTRYSDKGLSSEQQQNLDKDFNLIREMNFVDSNAKYYVHR